MKGLIKKDLLLIKGNIKTFVILLIVLLLMSINGTQSTLYVLPVIALMLFITTFGYDEYNKWDTYANTLPYNKKDIVKSKYITAILLQFLSIIFSLIIVFCINIFKNDIIIKELIQTLGGALFASVCFISFIFPLIYKFGSEKGRVVFFGLLILLMCLIEFLTKNYDGSNLIFNNIISFVDKYGLFIVIIVPVVFLIISYNISKKIYIKKDF